MASGFTHDVLISYVAADRWWGERMANVLGQKYKVAKLEDGATKAPSSLSDALSWAGYIVPILSQSSRGSADAKCWASLHVMACGERRVLPVRVDQSRFSCVLGALGSIDLTSVDRDKLDAYLLKLMKDLMKR